MTSQGLADSLIGLLRQGNDGASRVVVGLAGIPGAGKTTLAESVCQDVNAQYKSDVCVVIPMDGFHLTRAQLDLMDDPKEAHRRRGAPFTFDAQGLVDFVESLHSCPNQPLYAPSFDHSVGDPVPNNICVLPQHKIIIVEGLYLHLSVAPWNQLKWDVRWFLACEKDVAIQRLVARHVKTGVETSKESARNRVLGSDMLNADFILENLNITNSNIVIII